MFKSRQAWLASGVVVGLIVGLNVGGYWPQIPVHATATAGENGFAIATGPIGGDVEAVFILDYVTGDLRAAVLNLQTCKFSSFYQYNVGKDLAAGIKNPRYLMVTGLADLRRGANGQLGSCVVYVAEFTSGKMAAYGLPWTVGRENVAVPYQGTLVLIDALKIRTAAIR